MTESMQALMMISNKEYHDLAQNGARVLFDYHDYRLLDGFKDETRSYFLKDFKTEQIYLLDMETCYTLVTGFYCRGYKPHILELLDEIVLAESKRLPIETWKNIFRNIEEAQLEQGQEEGIEELIKEGVVERIEVEVQWLDSGDEWCLCSDCEMFEDGFKSEQEAQERLNHIEGVIADEAKNV